MYVLRHRSFAWLMAGQFVSTIGDNFYVMAIYWYVIRLTHSPWAVLWIGVAQPLPTVASLFWGVWIDAWNKRSVMIGSDVFRGLIAALLATVTLLDPSPPVVLLFVFVLFLRSLGTFFGPAANSLMPGLVPASALAEASGLLRALTAVASLIGVSLGGALMVWVGPPWLFALDAFSFLISVASLGFVRVSTAPPPPHQGTLPLFGSWRAGIRVLWSSLWLRRLVVVAALLNLVLVPLEMVLPQWVHGPLGGTAATLGWINAAFLVGYIGGAMAVTFTRRWSASRVIGIGFCALGIFTVAFGHVVEAPWPYVIASILGIFMGLVESTITGVMMQAIPQAIRGRTWSAFSGLINGVTPLGMIGTEMVIAHWGMPWLFTGIGILVVILSLTFVIPAPLPTAAALERVLAP